MDKKSVMGCVILLCLSILTTGCWDRREIDERNFVLAIGIDMADAGLKSGIKPEQAREVRRIETFSQPHGSKRYRLSLQILNMSPGSGEQEKSKAYVISNTGESFFEMIRDMLGQSSKALWFEHLQVIIISEAVLKQAGLGEILDFFKRDSEMGSRIKIYVTSGEARSLLEYIPPSKEAGGVYLADIIRNQSRNSHVAGAKTDLGYTIEYLDNKANINVPRIELADKVVKLGGAAAFEKDHFIGYVDEYAIAGWKFIAGTEKSAIITIPCPDHPDHQAVFELFRHDTRLRPHVDGDAIYYTLDITMYGSLAELQGDIKQDNTMDAQYIHKLENAFADEVKRNVIYAMDISQKKLKTDVRNLFAAKLKAHEPDAWEKVKDQWAEIYPDIPLVISANVFINEIGIHK